MTDYSQTRLSGDEFKAEASRKGWTYRAMAMRWGVSENYLSKVARNQDRPMHWDDALRGLPFMVRVTAEPKPRGRPKTKTA